ncbi:MAG: RNA polymerase sigma factor [Sedimentibacter sp.]
MNSDINYIIQESLNGDKNYQEILLSQLNPLIYKNIYKYWNSRDSLTEDLLQEGYAVILESLKTFDRNRNVHFLYYVKTKIQYFYKNYFRITKKLNYEINLSKNIKQKNFELEKIAISNFNTLENVVRKEESSELLTSIKKLSEKEQKIIYLYYYKNKSLKEISINLNVPYRTVIGKKKGALRKLKKLLEVK